MHILSNISLLALTGYLLVYIVILIVISLRIHCKSTNVAPKTNKDGEHKRASRDGPNYNTTMDLDVNMTDNDLFYKNKLSIELQKSSYGTQKVHSASVANESNCNRETQTNNNEFIVNEKFYNQSWFCLKYRVYLELLLYVIGQATCFGAMFVYISQSKCSYITTSISNFDFYYILFLVSALSFLFYKLISALSILIITHNCKYFTMQMFDVLIIYQSIKEIKTVKRKLWIQQYLQCFQSIFGSLPQLIIAFVFLLKQINENGFNDIIIWSSIISSLYSLIYFSICNYKIGEIHSVGIYVCRFLEITSRLALIILIWRYFGALYLRMVLFVEIIYLMICVISSHNPLLLANILYIMIDVYGYKKSKYFIGYRIVSNYVYGIIIALLLLTNILDSFAIDINLNHYNLWIFHTINSNLVNEKYFFYLFVYSLGVQPFYEIFLFCRYLKYIKSIGQCSDFKQLLNEKCFHQIYELMKLGTNYKQFEKHNEENLLCVICKEKGNNVELIHLQIAELYLSQHMDIFSKENRFYLPFFNAIQFSSISMINLLISQGRASIFHLFENFDWCNSLQCIILSAQPSMNKIEHIINLVSDSERESFLNYQNGSNYDTALLMLYRTNDYLMMDLGFDRLEAMQYLIQKGADINILDANKCSVLHYATLQKEWRLIRMLIKNGGEINLCNNLQQTPACIACCVECDDLKIIKLLLNPTMINKQDAYGRTIMHYAACYCYFDICNYLIERNADCFIQDNDGLTPLHFAIRNNNMNESQSGGLSMDIMILLIVVGQSNINSKDYSHHSSILHDAAKYQSIEVINYLIQNGANIYNLDKSGHTAKIYSFGRVDQNKIMKYWKDIYLNNYIYKEIISNYNRNNESNLSDDDIEVSELSNTRLEAFQSIICDETQIDIINK